jgi:hypothetical protein
LYATGIPLSVFAINDNASGIPMWGSYFECDRMVPGSGICSGIEIDTANQETQSYPITPYAQSGKQTVNLQLGCGSGWIKPSIGNCSAAANIVANPHPFLVGLNVMAGAVQGPMAPVVNLPTGTCIVWRNTDNSVSNKICG